MHKINLLALLVAITSLCYLYRIEAHLNKIQSFYLDEEEIIKEHEKIASNNNLIKELTNNQNE